MALKTEEIESLLEEKQTTKNSDDTFHQISKAKLDSNPTKREVESKKNINTNQGDSKTFESSSNTGTESANRKGKTQHEKKSSSNKECIKKDKEETYRQSNTFTENESFTQNSQETRDIQDEPQIETLLIDISIIDENDDRVSNQNGKNGASEIGAALSEMPGISKSISQEILSKLKEDPTKEIDEIDSKSEVTSCETLMDITVVDESDKDCKVQKEEEHSFEAEIIGDYEEITISPKDDEDVIEYTLETKHFVPFLTIMAALVSIFIGLIFYNN